MSINYSRKSKTALVIIIILTILLFMTLEYVHPLRVAEGALSVSVVFLSIWIVAI